MSRRCSSTPTSTSASSRRPPSRCSASFPATSAGRSRTSARWPPMALCWRMPERCCAPSRRSSGRSRPQRRLVHPPHPAVPHPGQRGRGRRHHLCRHHRAAAAADALEAAKRQAELANVAKSRFLAAASHDLRQPLQTLVLLQGLLAKIVEGERAQKLVARLDETLGAMSGMLNTLLDINQIEAGTVHAEIVDFPINDLLERLRDEFTYHAQAKRLALRVVPCGLSIQQRSAPARADDPQPAFERAEIHQARQGAARLPAARRNAEHRGLGHRHRHPRGGTSGDLRGVPSARQSRARTKPRPWPRSFHRAAPGEFAGPSDARPLAPGKGSVFAVEVMLPPSETASLAGPPSTGQERRGR